MLQFPVMQQSRSVLWSASPVILLACVAAGTLALVPTATAAPAAGAQAPSFQAEEGPEGVRNYTRVDATVACAGATPPEAMAVLRERGFTTIVNFRTAGENGATVDAGQAAAEAAGLKYVPYSVPAADAGDRRVVPGDGGRPGEPAGLHPLRIRQPASARCG